MPQEVILLKLGEIALKGLNRRTFEDVLLKNIRRRLQSAGGVFRVLPPVHHLRSTGKRRGRHGFGGGTGFPRSLAWWATPGRGVCEKALPAICQRAASYLAEDLDRVSSLQGGVQAQRQAVPLQVPGDLRRGGPRLAGDFPPPAGGRPSSGSDCAGGGAGALLPLSMPTPSPARGGSPWGREEGLRC